MAIDSLGRECDHRTPCDEGSHEESPNGCRDQTCDCPCHSWLGQAIQRVPEVLADLGALREPDDITCGQADEAALLAALDVVLALHRKLMLPASSGPERGKHYCVGCYRDVDHHVLYTLWPCPTYAAISSALLGEEAESA